jgi:hypothetical protein
MSRDSQQGIICWVSHVRAKFKSRFVATAIICCAVSGSTWLSVQWWPQQHDFEQCSEEAERTASSKDERASFIARCDKQSVGRRKMGGEYTYFDFLQNRHFDITGPNPTPRELKHFDEEYTLYLDAQRRDEITAAIAEKQSQKAQIDFQNDQHSTGPVSPPGPPMVITPTNVPNPEPGGQALRSKGPRCKDASLPCTWTKFSAEMK